MRIEAIWRYPVKSMAGARLDAAELGRLGVPGDRVAYVVDERGETVSARTRPRLLGLCAGLDDNGAPTVNGDPPDAPAVAELVQQAAGPGARLVRARSSERFDILPLLVATDGAVQEGGVGRATAAAEHRHRWGRGARGARVGGTFPQCRRRRNRTRDAARPLHRHHLRSGYGRTGRGCPARHPPTLRRLAGAQRLGGPARPRPRRGHRAVVELVRGGTNRCSGASSSPRALDR